MDRTLPARLLIQTNSVLETKMSPSFYLQKLLPTAFAWYVLALASVVNAAPPTTAERFFERRVRPILLKHCVECHGPEKQESSLRLDSREAALHGGDSGPAIVAGKPADSLLVEAIRRDGLQMPPDQPLDDDAIRVLERWIRIGAPWPNSETPPTPALGDQKAIAERASQHWAFQPIRKPEPPVVAAGKNVQPIDAFVRHTLELEGLKPAEPADRRTLIRRVYLDVIGLPPSIEAVEDFVNDPAADAFEKVVDKLLASEHYGERWARHWLDIARYADTQDWRAQTDPRYPFAYTYRDYVIRSLNADKPYDQFLREQIAADFYTDQPDSPTLAALGFLTVGKRFRNDQLEQIADRVDVVTRGLMSLTVTCARCHDHKYDPVPIEDYYSLYGVFASTQLPDEFPRIEGGHIDAELVTDFQRQRQEKIAALEAYGEQLRKEAGTDLRQKLPTYFKSYFAMSIAKTTQIRGALTKFKVKETAMTPLASHLDLLRRGGKKRDHRVFGPWVLGLAVPEAQFKQRMQQWLAKMQRDGDSVNDVVCERLTSRPPTSRSELVAAYADLFDTVLKEWSQLKRSNAAANKLADPAKEEVRQALIGQDGVFLFSTEEVVRASRLLGAGRRKLGEFEQAIREVEANHPGSPPRAMVLQEKAKPLNPFVMLRGEPTRRGPQVPRQFLSILCGEDRAPFSEGSGRRELAEAITDPSNPLTARVLVNRVWMKYFGAGLVLTPGDFGLRSDPPSHPELLDWLAATFIEDGWSLKKLHRLILLSATYQQSSEGDEANSQSDPENRLLWRQNRKRLDFEAMRDAMLACSGEIDLTIGGRSIPLSAKPFTKRRTLYGYIDRVDMDPLFKTFDFASPDASAPERPQTTVPQQALFAMNHPFVVQQARALVRLTEDLDDNRQRVQQLYQRVFGRRASDEELTLAVDFVESPSADAMPVDTVWQYGYGPVDRTGTSQPNFTPLPHWSGQTYQASVDFPDPKLGHLRLTRVGGHPGRVPLAVIRRWISPIDGTVRVAGKLTHRRDKGDGIRARVVAGTKTVGEWTVFNGSAEATVVGIPVRKGEAIDFVVDCVKTPTADAFLWAPVIRVVSGQAKDSWSARDDFAAPPPPPLTTWEQLAQALMLTNEFLYID